MGKKLMQKGCKNYGIWEQLHHILIKTKGGLAMYDKNDYNKWAFIRGCTIPALLVLMIAAICFGG